MLINLSNHPSAKWSAEQKHAAESQFGEIVDLLFPHIPAEWDTAKVSELANDYLYQCKRLLENESKLSAVHLAGEPVFCFVLANLLLKAGINCITSTTERIVMEKNNGTKISEFKFCRFREYLLQ
jgi:hypothetical protein